jgi:TldD protein
MAKQNRDWTDILIKRGVIGPDQLKEAQRMGNVRGADIGKFEIVLDGYAMASFIAQALGVASEMDRVRGFEANRGGTSYLATPADPLAPLGAKPWAPPFLDIRGTRSMPRGVATVRWDDEGVAPDEFDVIRDGVLVDYPTTRQQVELMRDLYARRGQPLRSHGCSASGTAMDFPLVTPPNLVMSPNRTTTTFDDLVKSVTDGYAVTGGRWSMDQQELTGMWVDENSMVYRVKRGKIVGPVAGMGLMIRSPDVWKNLVASGDATTQRTRGIRAVKGQPPMWYQYSVSAPAVKVSGLTVVDWRRGLRA